MISSATFNFNVLSTDENKSVATVSSKMALGNAGDSSSGDLRKPTLNTGKPKYESLI